MKSRPEYEERFGRRGFLGGAALLVAGVSLHELLPGAPTRPFANAVPLPDFRDPGDADDSRAFERALRTGRPVFLPAAGGSGEAGTYVVGQIELANGSIIYGEGDRTVLRRRDRDVRHIFHAEGAGPESSVQGIQLHSLCIDGRAPGLAFREHWNSIEFAGVQDVTIEGVHFRGFVSDAIMFAGESLGAGRAGPLSPRHNRRIVVRDCSFDGIDRDNRNAISIVDGLQVLIEGCSFQNCTRHDMPGAIDIEPNPYPFYRIENITIRNCTFTRCGGSNGSLSLFVPAEVRAVPRTLSFIGNRFETNSTSDIYINLGRRWEEGDPGCAIRIAGNRGLNGQSPWRVISAKGVAIGGDNIWTDYAASALLGYSDPRAHVRDFTDEATYVRVGRGGPPAPFGIAVFNVTNARLGGRFVDCGDGGADAAAIAFITDGARGIEISNARFSAPTRKTAYAVRAFAGLRRGAAQQSGNDYGGLASDLSNSR